MYSYRIRVFLRMNPSEFNDFDAEKEQNWFIDEVYKTLDMISLNFREKAQLDTYQLKYTAQVLYVPWNDSIQGRAGLIE